MRQTLWLAPVFLSCIALAADCPKNQPKDGSALVKQEQTWAEALGRHDTEAVGCILAEEFQDTDPNGAVHDRAQTLAAIPGRRSGTNVLSDLEPHVFGDFGYIRGLATLVDVEGTTLAQVRFTDVYVYRGGRWLAVAGQESMVRKLKQEIAH